MKAPQPPDFRAADLETEERCGTCKMYWAGRCWGFGNTAVGKEDVCDNWARDPEMSDVIRTLADGAGT